ARSALMLEGRIDFAGHEGEEGMVSRCASYRRGSGVVKADTDPLVPAGIDHHLVPEPAFPQEDAPGRRLGIDERVKMLGRIVGAAGRCHQHRQPRVFKFQRARPRWHRDVESARDNTVRMNMAAMRAARLHQIDPETVEPKRLCETETGGLGKSPHLAAEPALEVINSEVAL